MRPTLTNRLALVLMLALALPLAAQVVPAGVSAAAEATGMTKKRPKHKKTTRTTTVTVTVTTPAPAAAAGQLVGTFKITAGSYANNAPHGSWFRMILPGGNASKGPFFGNVDSTSSDKSYTLLNPGTDGGLVTGAFQAAPSPAFASNGNALAQRIITPTKFFGVDFSASTAAKDPQTGRAVAAPSLTVTDGRISGDLRAFSAEWNTQYFNQGSPKPDGGTPGITSPVTGTYDKDTHAFAIDWTSSIVGGPFNGFTGRWHLEGTFLTCGPGPAQ